MNLTSLRDTPPWDWPEGTGRMLLEILRDDGAEEADLLLAVEAAGDVTVVNDELVEALLSILRSDKAEEVRARAAIALGQVLEQIDTQGFDDPMIDPTITARTFHTIQETLRRLYADATVPQEVRRRILEAAVRAPKEWHRGAVSTAWSTGDEAWRLTAIFCMRFVRGFDGQILEALGSENPDIRYEAVLAAGSWGVAAAWPHVSALLTVSGTEKPLFLAAIEASVSIRPREAVAILNELADSEDEEVVEAVEEALALAEDPSVEEEEEEDDAW
jgi:HEAT repeat protein